MLLHDRPRINSHRKARGRKGKQRNFVLPSLRFFGPSCHSGENSIGNPVDLSNYFSNPLSIASSLFINGG